MRNLSSDFHFGVIVRRGGRIGTRGRYEPRKHVEQSQLREEISFHGEDIYHGRARFSELMVFEISLQRWDETRNRSLFTLFFFFFFFLVDTDRAGRGDGTSLEYRQYPKVVSLDYLYFFFPPSLPFPSSFYLFPSFSCKPTLLIRHRVKEDGT